MLTNGLCSTTDNAGGIFATNPPTTLATATTKASSSDASPTPASTTSSVAATPTNAGSSSPTGTPSGGNTPGSACSPEGAYACLSGGSSFQRCASGQWSVVQQMATGTTCTTGVEANLDIVAVDNKQKRHRFRQIRHM